MLCLERLYFLYKLYCHSEMLKVKICGITSLEDGLNAVRLGADYIGFVFYDKSPRSVSIRQAQEIGEGVPNVKRVGLFVDENPDRVRQISATVGLDVLQFHGNESPRYCEQFPGVNVWKAIRVQDASSLTQIPKFKSVATILLDAYVPGKEGGTGETFNWELAKQAKEYGKWIVLAGGLDQSNVAQAISIVDPFCVDVSSGVEESKGKKSMEKMKAFIEAVKGRSN